MTDHHAGGAGDTTKEDRGPEAFGPAAALAVDGDDVRGVAWGAAARNTPSVFDAMPLEELEALRAIVVEGLATIDGCIERQRAGQ